MKTAIKNLIAGIKKRAYEIAINELESSFEFEIYPPCDGIIEVKANCTIAKGEFFDIDDYTYSQVNNFSYKIIDVTNSKGKDLINIKNQLIYEMARL